MVYNNNELLLFNKAARYHPSLVGYVVHMCYRCADKNQLLKGGAQFYAYSQDTTKLFQMRRLTFWDKGKLDISSSTCLSCQKLLLYMNCRCIVQMPLVFRMPEEECQQHHEHQQFF